ncbi:hypothetical protein NBO_655g0004 [Nosema bombycis CQ1]|uniref:HEAT repeat domain-containing protein n=1 Tax=Nosema bombycis (strain CQ1 / CVCC 102059) TaxID=578461 RepID=R0KMN8_NOSB1|nr:hypothetical protein NBO_655g0004 [Nosema bombycis CQ1]|eukprot:EOB11906.1 hypothetical protein NBO_655g0004 [Nosema bombycis CQ1]
MNFKIVNELINNKNGKGLAKLFNFGVDLSGVKTSKIYSPFEDLFKKQQLFFEIRTYENAEEVVKSAFYVLDEGDYTYYLAKKVIMNCLSFIYNENENKNKETLAKTLANFTKVSNDIRYYAFNVLSQLYFEMSKFELLENLLLVSSNTRQRKLDFYVYNLYKGITLFYLDRFKESFISLTIAFKSKRLKTFVLPLLFVCHVKR